MARMNPVVLHRDMQLNDLFPEKAEFYLESRKKTYTLRVPNLEDRARFKDILGNESRINEVFQNLEWDIIAKLVYRLLVEKSDFVAYQEKGYNDDGVEVTYLITGPALLMRAVSGMEEAIRVLTALVTALRLGDPLVDKAVKAGVEKKSLENLTGERSLTPSPQSTDTPQSSLAS